MRKRIPKHLPYALTLIALLVGVFALLAWHKPIQLSLNLNGERDVYIDFGEDYQDPGASAGYMQDGASIDVPVTVSGEVNTKKTGKYVIKYTAQAEGAVCTGYRHVHVVDREPPVISLASNPDSFTLLNHTYQEEGFTATDNYDGDLTAQVFRAESEGIITYTVADSAGNTATVSRTVNYIDPGAPTLQLEGGQAAFVFAGDVYEEPGYSATDIRDGDLSPYVIVSGDVDAEIPGIYTLNYSVTNSLGSTATLDRTIYVIPRQESDTENSPENPPEQNFTNGTAIEPNGKVIYLTFDDGPSKHTGKLLDVLKKYGIKATFFVVQSSEIDMIARAAQEGHTVAIHTYTHNYQKIYANDEAYMADLTAMQDVILQQTGQISKLFRFPGGSSNSVSSAYNKGIMTRLTQKLQAMGYQYFDWNVDSNDAGGARTSEQVFQNVTNGVANRQNSVVLQHDTQEFSVDAVEKIIAWGLCNGYSFQPLTSDSPTAHHSVRN